MTGKIVNLLKEGNIVIPKILLFNYKKLKLEEIELIVLIYLINNPEFDPVTISEELSLKKGDVLNILNSLSQKDIVKIESIKRNNVCEEVIILDELYNKLALILMENKEEKEHNLFDIFENEFGRTLSPMEYEIIGAWSDSYNREVILAALKEAIYNGVSNLRYIDKILFEWNKKGIKSVEDIKNKQSKKETKKEVFDYDWLNE